MEKNIGKKEFALEEYKTLRVEILSKMSNQYKILTLGVGGITVIFGAIFKLELYELFFVLPALIFANAYLYKAETHAMINAGSYIKKIENCLYRNNSNLNGCDEDKAFADMGWENSLKRKIYKPFEYAADIIFGSLYIMSVTGARTYNQAQVSPIASDAGMVVYIIILVCWIYYIIRDKVEGDKNGKITKGKK